MYLCTRAAEKIYGKKGDSKWKMRAVQKMRIQEICSALLRDILSVFAIIPPSPSAESANAEDSVVIVEKTSCCNMIIC